MKWFSKRSSYAEIDPDEIFLDSSNLPSFDTHQFEGRIERSISRRPFWFVGALFIFLVVAFLTKAFGLQVVSFVFYREASENNSLRHVIVFNERGVIFDRNGVVLAENVPGTTPTDFFRRVYPRAEGLAHVLGYVNYPAKDKDGYFYQKEFVGKDGVEEFYGEELSGDFGVHIVETDANGTEQSAGILRPPRDGKNLTLSVDARLSKALSTFIGNTARAVGFRGGAGIIMDAYNGEILALTSFPEYDPAVLTDGKESKEISSLLTDERTPFLNRAVSGLYIPGSIIKPFIALAALNEHVIAPEKEILSTGSISIPNPYLPGEESIFHDWKAHGLVNMRRALAVSSNVYFFEVGGGFEDQKGLGIGKIEQYMRLFGFGKLAGVDLYGEEAGNVPGPVWKERVFADEWRIGDTYNTSIGQYGFQITPMQAVRAIAAIGNGGTLPTPHLLSEDTLRSLSRVPKDTRIKIPEQYFDIVREGLRDAVLYGTAQALFVPEISVAAKTGTAEVGVHKDRVNSWVIGFFPYENPKYAFAVVMESGNPKNLVGASAVMREMLQWMARETPEYFAEQPR